MDWNNYDYTYLRPPQEVFQIQHTKEYIHQGEGKKAFRKQFYKTTYDAAETEKLRQFKEMIAAEKIETPYWWNDAENLKLIYACKWNLKESIKHMKEHLKWATDPAWHTLSPESARLLEEGIIYTLGKDKDMRPIIVTAVYKIDLTKMNTDHLMKALCFACDVVKKHCFVPGYVENWILIFETREVGLFAFPFKALGKVIGITSDNYISTVEKIYIMNPSFALNTSWSIISKMIDSNTVKKIGFIKKKDYHKLQEYIPKSSLEKKFGGDLPDFEGPFWPPPNIYKHKPYLWPWETAPCQPFSNRDGPLSTGANPPLDWEKQPKPLVNIETGLNQISLSQAKCEEQKLDGGVVSENIKDSKPIVNEIETNKVIGQVHEIEHQKNPEIVQKNDEKEVNLIKNEQEITISTTTANHNGNDKIDAQGNQAMEKKPIIEESPYFNQSQGVTLDQSPELQQPNNGSDKVKFTAVEKGMEVKKCQEDENANESEGTRKSSFSKANGQGEEVEGEITVLAKNDKRPKVHVRATEPQLEGPAPEMRFCGYCSRGQNKSEGQGSTCSIF